MLKAQDMSVAKSEVAAKLMAITVFQAAHNLDTVGNPLMAAIRDEAIKLSHEILALHDVKADEVLVAPGGSETGGNNHYGDTDN